MNRGSQKSAQHPKWTDFATFFCNLACILARQAAKESGKQVECQNAHHEHRSGTARNRVQVGHHTFAVDLPNVHRKRLGWAEHIPRARSAQKVETREIEHGRRLARRVNERRGLSDDTSDKMMPVIMAGNAAGSST